MQAWAPPADTHAAGRGAAGSPLLRRISDGNRRRRLPDVPLRRRFAMPAPGSRQLSLQVLVVNRGTSTATRRRRRRGWPCWPPLPDPESRAIIQDNRNTLPAYGGMSASQMQRLVRHTRAIMAGPWWAMRPKRRAWSAWAAGAARRARPSGSGGKPYPAPWTACRRRARSGWAGIIRRELDNAGQQPVRRPLLTAPCACGVSTRNADTTSPAPWGMGTRNQNRLAGNENLSLRVVPLRWPKRSCNVHETTHDNEATPTQGR